MPVPADTHILVVEDDAQYRRLVTRILERAGYRVSPTEDFAAAMAVIEGRDKIDLLLADIGMPPGTPHGFSIGKIATLKRRDLKIIYMSGSNPAGFALFQGEPMLAKPFTATELLATIEAALR